jgi:hypothetical protein
MIVNTAILTAKRTLPHARPMAATTCHTVRAFASRAVSDEAWEASTPMVRIHAKTPFYHVTSSPEHFNVGDSVKGVLYYGKSVRECTGHRNGFTDYVVTLQSKKDTLGKPNPVHGVTTFIDEATAKEAGVKVIDVRPLRLDERYD